jgi:hypothetical protein
MVDNTHYVNLASFVLVRRSTVTAPNPLQTALEDQLRLAHKEIERLREAGDRVERSLRQITQDGQWPADREITDALAGWEAVTE